MIRHRKLTLRRETVRVLGAIDLRAAHGGISGDFCVESGGVPCVTNICATNVCQTTQPLSQTWCPSYWPACT